MAASDLQRTAGSQGGEILIQNFIAGLNVLKKNIRLYPPGHTTIARSREALSPIMEDIFDRYPTLTINAIKNNLLVNGKLIHCNMVHVQDFALYVYNLGIASLTFTKGLSSEDVQSLWELTGAIPPKNHIHLYKEILNEINAISNISLREINLSFVRFSDEEVVDGDEENEAGLIWQKLLLGCISPDLQHMQDAALLYSIRIYNQGSFNDFLQAFNIPEERLVQSYSNVLTDFAQSDSTQDEDLPGKQAFFSSMYNAFNEFTLALREKILSVSFDVINSAGDEASLEILLNCMPVDMVLDVLTQAVLDKRVISPTLIKLMGVLYRAGKNSSVSANDQGLLKNTIWERIAELFSREGYEHYLSEEYAMQLQNLSLGADSSQIVIPVAFVSDEHLETFQETRINRHLTSALLLLMGGNIDDQVYADYADNVALIVPELLEANDFEQLVAIYKSLRGHLEADKGPAAYQAALKTLAIYSDAAFVNKLAEAYSANRSGEHPALEELIALNAAKNIPWLVDKYLQQKGADVMGHTLTFLLRLGSRTAEHALNKLPGKNKEEAIALLGLIRKCAGKVSSAVHIQTLLKSKDKEIQLEAVETLLKLGEPSAISALRKLLRLKDDQAALKALQLVHDYKVGEMVCELASQIKTFYITEAGLARNKVLLDLLARMDYADALPVLKRKARIKITLSPHYLQQTKGYLSESLNLF